MTDSTPGTRSETLMFDALADGVRRRILECLSECGECTVSELASRIESVGRTTVSSHLRVLRTSGVVSERRQGRLRFYSLDRQGSVSVAVQYLQKILDSAASDVGAGFSALASDTPTVNDVVPLQQRSS
jgi:ArsR family transcriptional regulator, arsenate/arsenite/antimonite-responsive transcriptional repressor